jgi:hypothetical protein
MTRSYLHYVEEGTNEPIGEEEAPHDGPRAVAMERVVLDFETAR